MKRNIYNEKDSVVIRPTAKQSPLELREYQKYITMQQLFDEEMVSIDEYAASQRPNSGDSYRKNENIP